MAKPLLQLAAVGLVGFALWKVASFLFFPLLFWVVKVALIVGLVMLAFWFFNRKKNDEKKDDATAP
jgi:hypothetical protein